jgi:hypothetical protein
MLLNKILVKTLFEIGALKRLVLFALWLKIGEQGRIQDHKTWMRKRLLLAVFEQPECDRGVSNCSEAFAPTTSGLNQATGDHVGGDTPSATTNQQGNKSTIKRSRGDLFAKLSRWWAIGRGSAVPMGLTDRRV